MQEPFFSILHLIRTCSCSLTWATFTIDVVKWTKKWLEPKVVKLCIGPILISKSMVLGIMYRFVSYRKIHRFVYINIVSS